MSEPYRVDFSCAGRRSLHSIPPRIVPAIIEFVYGDLARNPHRVGRPLERELTGLHGARRGPYRVLYEIHDDQRLVMVVKVGYRADIYHSG